MLPSYLPDTPDTHSILLSLQASLKEIKNNNLSDVTPIFIFFP